MSQHLKVAICLYPGVQLLDFAGPLDLLSVLSATNAALIQSRPPVVFDITQLSTEDTVTATAGLVFKPQSTYAAELARAERVQYDVLLVPGGLGSSPGKTPAELIAFLKAQAPRAKYVLSLCSGSWILQQAGRAREDEQVAVQRHHHAVHWVRKARWVTDGNVWTASGVAAGMDMTIAFILHLAGPAVAAVVSSGIEYTACAQDDDPFADIWSDEAQLKLVESFGEHINHL